MKLHMCVQCSSEWWSLRRGKPTGSEFNRIMTPSKRKFSEGRHMYMAELIGDILNLSPNYFSRFGPTNSAIEHGKRTEAEARSWYEMERGIKVQQVGFITTDDEFWGCSPDGLCEDKEGEGGLELKCPMLKTHMRWVLQGTDKVPTQHLNQCHAFLLITGRKWIDFCSYAPGAPSILVRVYLDDYTVALAECCKKFEQEFRPLLEKHCADRPREQAEEIHPDPEYTYF